MKMKKPIKKSGLPNTVQMQRLADRRVLSVAKKLLQWAVQCELQGEVVTVFHMDGCKYEAKALANGVPGPWVAVTRLPDSVHRIGSVGFRRGRFVFILEDGKP